MIYDTLKLSKALRTSSTPEQLDALAQAFSESAEDTVATKFDIAGLGTEIADLRAEVAGVRSGLKTEIAALRVELETEITNLKVDMVRWIVGAIALQPARYDRHHDRSRATRPPGTVTGAAAM